MSDKKVVVYGASGYTGRLVAEFLREYQVPFIAAGRNRQRIDVRVSAELGSWVVVKDGERVIETFVFDAAADANDGVIDGFTTRRIDFIANQANPALNIPAEGPHPLSVEAFDVPGNRSARKRIPDQRRVWSDLGVRARICSCRRAL